MGEKIEGPAILPAELPVFPLPGVVFFPASVLPLHIFEPRYRAMVKDALEGDRLIAMALLKPGWEQQYDGAPAVYPVGCVGRIEEVQSLPDGRYNLALAGLCRVEFLEFLQDHPYRLARIRPLPETTESGGSERERREDELRLLAAFSSLHRALAGERADARMVAVNPGVPFEVLVNSLCLHAELEAPDKQRLLEMPDAASRCRQLTELFDRRLEQAIASGEVTLAEPPSDSVN